MNMFLICVLSVGGYCQVGIASNACPSAAEVSSVIKTNDASYITTEGLVADFVNKFVAAYNANDTMQLASLIDNESQCWILQRLKKTGGKMDIKVKEARRLPDMRIAAILRVTHSEMGTSAWNVLLQDVDGAGRLVKTTMPEIQKENEQLKETYVKAQALVSAVVSSDITKAESIFKEKKTADWVLGAMKTRAKVSIVRVIKDRGGISAEFSVVTDKLSTKEKLLYSTEGFYMDRKD